jgi:CDP-glucose 4,6-dehydratase
MVMPMTNEFWRGKRVLITGHTGFKGSWLTLWLRELGADVAGLSLAPRTEPSLHLLLGGAMDGPGTIDIRDRDAVTHYVLKTKPQIVFHLAAQALVRAGYRNPAETYDVNVLGTANLLDALRLSEDVRSIVVVTTDKVYHNAETGLAFMESDPLGGHDPYSASKAAAEIVAASYRSSFFAARRIGLATARAGNVIGGGDWAEDRLIPDAVRAWSTGTVLRVRRADAVRPWQHVLDPLAGYLRLAETLWTSPGLADAYNFGPRTDEAASVRDVIRLARAAYGRGEWRDESEAGAPHEAGRLALEVARARDVLGATARWPLAEAIGRTMRWYRGLADGSSAAALCADDLDAHERAGEAVVWSPTISWTAP